MGKRKKQHPNSDDRVPLQQALAMLKEKHPWAPIAALRKAVTEGRVVAVRSGLGPRARYYVKVSDLEETLLSVQVGETST